MDNKSDEQFMIMQSAIEANNQNIKANQKDSDEKTIKLAKDFKAVLVPSITSIKDQINTLKYSSTKKDSPNPPDPTTVVPDNRRDPPLDGGHYTKIGGMWTLKHQIISRKFYEILIKT